MRVFITAGSLFHSEMALKEKADCAKAEPRSETPQSLREAELEALLVRSEQSSTKLFTVVVSCPGL